MEVSCIQEIWWWWWWFRQTSSIFSTRLKLQGAWAFFWWGDMLHLNNYWVIFIIFHQLGFCKTHVRPRGQREFTMEMGHFDTVQCHQAQDIWEHLFSIFLEFVNSSEGNPWNLSLKALHLLPKRPLFIQSVCYEGRDMHNKLWRMPRYILILARCVVDHTDNKQNRGTLVISRHIFSKNIV